MEKNTLDYEAIAMVCMWQSRQVRFSLPVGEHILQESLHFPDITDGLLGQ